MIDGNFEGSPTEMRAYDESGKESVKCGRCAYIFFPIACTDVYWCKIARVEIDLLPDLALLEIFDHCKDDGVVYWYPLVHVCRRWRNVILASPRRLNLRLLCTAGRRTKEMLDVWPLLPVVVRSDEFEVYGVDYMIPALEQSDRVCELQLIDVPCSQLDKVLSAMQQPFPALTYLAFLYVGETLIPPVAIPASFLGGSAPRLQTLMLDYFPFPGLSNLLLSATHLVELYLRRIPHSEFFSPETIVTCLSVLTKLQKLSILFEFHQRLPGQRRQLSPPHTRTLVPALTLLGFSGDDEYLEDLVAQIDAPLLNGLRINFYDRPIFYTPQLARFISRTPNFKTHEEARVTLSNWDVSITLPQTFGEVDLSISCTEADGTLFLVSLESVAEVCSSSFPQSLISAVEHLYLLEDEPSVLYLQDNIENSQWLEVLHPFTGVKSLYLSSRITPRIVPVLQEFLGERVTEVLPALQTLFLEETLPSGPAQETIGQFVAARQLSSRPISISRWKWESGAD